MGHRHLFNTLQVFENEHDHDQNWNQMHSEQPYLHLAQMSAGENVSLFPGENISVEAEHFSSHWHPGARPNGYSSSNQNAEVPHYQQPVSGPSHNYFMHPLATGSFCIAPENHGNYISSSNYERPAFHGIDNDLVDHSTANGRGLYKRKSPGVSTVIDRGNTSRYYNGESSSGHTMSLVSRHDKPHTDCQHLIWDPTIHSYSRGNALSIGGEGSSRNVRSRPALDLEINIPRPQMSINHPQHPYTSCYPINNPNPVDLSSQNFNGLALELNQGHVPPPVHGRDPVSGRNVGNVSTNNGGYHHDFTLNRNLVIHQNLHDSSSHGVRGACNRYSQRSTPSFRASSNNLHVGQFRMSNDNLHLGLGTYSFRQSRSLHTLGWRNGERNGRSRESHNRYRTHFNEATRREQLGSEAFMIVNHSDLYGSRNVFDLHREMRLDVDNMSYEELIALGERIGNVSTGLSEDMIAKCLTEKIFHSSDQVQKARCVICLEEYENMNEIGMLKNCSHEYHTECIKKWLSMKNMCPICKASTCQKTM